MNYSETLLSGKPVVLDSGESGPNVVILCAVHGNEPCGVEALKNLLPVLNIKKGKVTCVLANPAAYKDSARGTESNLNRVFENDEILSKEDIGSYEYKRSKFLTKFLKDADYLLDVHSYYNKRGQPFVICEPKSFDIVKNFDVNIVLSGLDEIHQGSTDRFMNSIGKYGICIECGQHDDSSSIGVAEDSIKRFLSNLGMIDGFDFVTNTEMRYANAEYMHISKVNFKPSREYKNFEKIKKGEVLGTDGGDNVIAPYDGFIVFCNELDESGEEAFVFGKFLE